MEAILVRRVRGDERDEKATNADDRPLKAHGVSRTRYLKVLRSTSRKASPRVPVTIQVMLSIIRHGRSLELQDIYIILQYQHV